MHAGNIFAALCSWLIAKLQGGSIVLRIEDLDSERSRQCYIDAIQRDFERLGLFWDEGPYFQHNRTERYQEAFEQLDALGKLYPCYCSRADLHAASAPHAGEKLVYPATCRHLSAKQRHEREAERKPATRLIVSSDTVAFCDVIQGPYSQQLSRDCGDFLIKRSDGAFAYQLAVVIDDEEQGINSVTRGVDLLCSTPQQMYLRSLLFPECSNDVTYAHIPLLVSASGHRLSKRNKDAEIDALIERYGSPEAVLGRIAYVCGLAPTDVPVTPEELLDCTSIERIASALDKKIQILWE